MFCSSCSPFLRLTLWASAKDLTVTVIDQDLGTPLEGVRLSVRGVEGTFKTGADGKATIGLPAGHNAALVTAELPGYETKKTVVTQSDTALVITLALSGVVEGNELVVEKSKPNSTDAENGVSQAVTKKDITNTTMGVVQDLMSTIKTLPGVGYTSGFNAMPSIQGGNPSEMTAVLDGAYVLYPYHWNGAVSIFNPDMVDSAKLSDGIVSARYGEFLSGLLEVTSISPNKVQPTADLGLSTSGIDFFVSAPFSETAGLLLGGQTTYLQLPLAFFGLAKDAPYITEGFGKLSWDPSPRVKWFLDAYLGVDGVKADNLGKQPPPPDTLTTTRNVDLVNTEAILASGLKLLLRDNLLLSFLVNFNNHDQNLSVNSLTNGTEYYDQDFIKTYSSLLNGATSFTLNNLAGTVNNSTNDYLYQFKGSMDWQLAEGHLLSFGVESVLRNSTLAQSSNNWQTVYSGTTPQFEDVVSDVSTNGDNTLTSALYADYTFSLWSGLLTGEAGVRGNYTVVSNSDMTLLTRPSVDPRIRLVLTPIRNTGAFQSLSFVAGTGLFSQFPVDNPFIDTQYGVTNYQVGPTLAWFNELGLEAVTKDGWTLDLDGYYKSYSDRFYAIANNAATPVSYSTYSDGTGFAYGIDAFIQKQTRYWEGWLSYTFVVTRLYNPAQAGNTDTDGDPTGIWYYPSYNIQHTISLVLTLMPTDGFSLTTEAQIASGAPLDQFGPVTSYEATMPDGTVVERFSRTSTYSDTLRTGWSFPIDLKASWHGYYKGSKIGWEFYVAVQDLLAPFYTAAAGGPPPFDPWRGTTLTGATNASSYLGVPIPSIGYNLSY